MSDPSPDRTTTARGFAVYDEFTDLYGADVRVQKSSYASEPAVWIFAEKHPAKLGVAVHLTIEQAKRVRDALDAFITENSEAKPTPAVDLQTATSNLVKRLRCHPRCVSVGRGADCIVVMYDGTKVGVVPILDLKEWEGWPVQMLDTGGPMRLCGGDPDAH